jgi:hypothetical protein
MVGACSMNGVEEKQVIVRKGRCKEPTRKTKT